MGSTATVKAQIQAGYDFKLAVIKKIKQLDPTFAERYSDKTDIEAVSLELERLYAAQKLFDKR